VAENNPVPGLDPLVHERARLLILSYLAGAETAETSFNELKSKLELSAGNLSIQLKKLEQAGLVRIRKEFRNNKPHTTLVLSAAGLRALRTYLKQMETMIKAFSR
jgi:DNA-binding HxlR family transcriptional regulator